MYGRRGRVGVVLPSNNTVLEPELYRMVSPEEVSVHFTRLLTRGGEPEHLRKMVTRTRAAVTELAAGAVDVVLYACLSTSVLDGWTWDDEFARHVAAVGAVPCETAARATVAALGAVGATRVCLVTPYSESMHERVLQYFRAHGPEVVASARLEVGDVLDVCRHEPSEVVELALEAWSHAADALCVVATDLRTIDAIAPLEEALRAPVVTTNQALLWTALRLAHVDQPIAGFGRLLEEAGH